MKKALLLLVILSLLLLPLPVAAEEGIDLSALMDDPVRRGFVEGMVNYAMTGDAAVKQALSDGYIALFFFDGGSDNMNDPVLSDISYYRVSALCVAVRLQSDGSPGVVYFNDNCSTLPDRPLEYGKKTLEDGTLAGPATVMDGTYELYSVKHNGAYEALHIQTTQSDETVAAVYMTPEGYVNAQASQINIHTRTGNHVIEKAMWSAGCLLVGDGDFGAFTELVQSTYYASYDTYEKDQFVGTVTINRQLLKQELYELYEDRNGVDMLLSESRRILPEKYLAQCREPETWEEPRDKLLLEDAALMTLPCATETDVRSVAVGQLEKGESVTVSGSIVNSRGSLWYITPGGYVYGGCVGDIPIEEPEEPQEPGFWGRILGWLGR